jgi:DNA mismatch endonuclease (patch repair protein)
MTRSQMMARIGPKDTTPELTLRKAHHGAGMRYRLHCRDLPGRPDIVMRPYRLAIFVHGCFWHRHPGCRHATEPRTNTVFWLEKFARNRERDRRKRDQLLSVGWTVGEVWECELRDPRSLEECIEAVRVIKEDAGTA